VNVLQCSDIAETQHRYDDNTEECDERDRQDQRLAALSGAAATRRVT
jgi:hypothetical protein